jgi:hypothetical protein
MKRKIALTLCLLMCTPILLAFAPSVKAPDGIHRFAWVEPDYIGYDPYYDENIVGYLEGKYWNLSMMWMNEEGVPINVSAIRVFFYWGKNYTQRFDTPIQVMPGDVKTFNVYNVTPTIKEAPELLGPHMYDIYIEHLNNTEPPYEEYSLWFSWGENFVALSQDHLDCLNYWAKYWMFIEGPFMTQPQMIPPYMEFLYYANITQVQVLLIKALFEFSQGLQIYMAGVFGKASEHLQTGDQYINDALDVWNERGTAMEDADLAYKNAQANYYNGQGNYYTALGEASKTNAYGWLLFGLGWVFIGLGILVYGARKPKTAPPPS